MAEEDMNLTGKTGRFAQSMASSIDPVPPSGFLVRRGAGHVVVSSLPKLMGTISHQTELKLSKKLNARERRRLIQGLAKRKATLELGHGKAANPKVGEKKETPHADVVVVGSDG